MQREQVLSRLAALRKEFEAGQGRLRELETEQSYIRETMLRISGAIQVLEELLGEGKSGAEAGVRLDEAALHGPS
jgi:predicted nuclease with TOPRIM domain